MLETPEDTDDNHLDLWLPDNQTTVCETEG